MLQNKIINIPINTQFSYYFYLPGELNFNSGTNTAGQVMRALDCGPTTGSTFATGGIKLSKDGASFVNSTNLPTEIGNGWYKLVLTAAEMNFQDILIYIQTNSNDQGGFSPISNSAWLCTTSVGSGGGASASDIWSYSTRGLTEDVTTSNGLTAQQVWEYVTRTLTSSSGLTAQQVWEYATRSLTEDVTVAGGVNGATAEEVKQIVRKLILALGGK